MKCKQIKENLRGYLDGTLSPGDSREIKEHLALCQECSKAFSAIKLVETAVEKFRSAPELELPLGLHTRIIAGIQALDKEKKSFFDFSAFARLAGIATFASVVILAGVYLDFCKSPVRPVVDSTSYSANDFIAQSINQARNESEYDALSQKTSRFLYKGGQR